MDSHLVRSFLILVALSSFAGCARREVVERPRGCRHGEYIEGHHELGHWVPGHWRCEERRHEVIIR